MLNLTTKLRVLSVVNIRPKCVCWCCITTKFRVLYVVNIGLKYVCWCGKVCC